MPRLYSTTWSVNDPITAARLQAFNTEIDDLFVYGNDRGRIRVAASGTALRIDIAAFSWRVGDTMGQYAGGTDIVVTNTATNYVEINPSGSIAINTTAWVSTNTRLGTVTCSGGVVTAISIWKADAVGGALGGAELVNNETLAANRSVISTDKVHQNYDLNGTDRDVTLATASMSEGNAFVIKNASDGGELITLKQASTTLALLYPGYSVRAVFDGTNWVVEQPMLNITNTITILPCEYSALDALGYTVPSALAALTPRTTIFSDDFVRGDSNTVGNSWTENDGTDANNCSIDTNRLELRLNSGASGDIRVYKSHGALTLPVQMYGKIQAGGTISRDVWFGINGSSSSGAAGNFTGLRFQQTSASTHSIYANGSSAGTFTWDFSTGTTTYVWLDLFPNGSNIDINLYCSTTTTKPASPTKVLQNIVHSTANTNMMMYGDWNTIGQNIFFDDVAIYSLTTPTFIGIPFSDTTKQRVYFRRVLPSYYVAGAQIKYRIHWAADSSSTNSVVWGVRAVSLGDNEALTTAMGTAVEVTDANNAQLYKNQSAQSGVITIANTPVAGELLVLEVYRDGYHASDTLAVPAYFLGMDIQFM